MDKSIDEFVFFKGFDFSGNDLFNFGKKSIEELKNICNSDSRALGFNTLGFFKNHIDFSKLHHSHYFSGEDGLYVDMNKYYAYHEKLKSKSHIEFDGYTFHKHMDSRGNDLNTYFDKSLDELKLLSDSNNDIIAFNTNGSVKTKLSELVLSPSKLEGSGIYIKNKTLRIKMTCNWCSGIELCNEWKHMSKGDNKWNDIEITHEDNDIDFYVIINKPNPYEQPYYDPTRTIIFHMEPWCYDTNQNWGVKTWGEFAEPDEEKYLQVRSHKNFYNNAFWQLKTTYNEFKTKPIIKTKLLSTICSSKYFDPGHIMRIDFIKYIESKNEFKIDVWNHDNTHGFKGYQGPHPKGNKDVGMLPYKYYFMGENNAEHNFITEKIWESLITESLCFYWGCPNISEYIDPLAYIVLDLNDMEKSYQIVKDAIENDLWSQRIEIIRREKQKVLDYFQFFPTIERVLKHDFKFYDKPKNNDEVLYHKYFNSVIKRDLYGNHINNGLKNVCFIHSCTINNDNDILKMLLKKVTATKCFQQIFIINIGEKINFDSELVKTINYSKNKLLCEKPTINLMQIFSQFNQDVKVLYLHTKGISYNPIPGPIQDWTDYMLYCLVDKYKECCDLLTLYDTVGCNYHLQPQQHFSGNFWWANTNYMKKQEQITSNVRHDCEWWILKNNPNKFTINNSGINHYHSRYPLNEYKNTVDTFLESKYNIDIPIKCINLLKRNDRKEKMTILGNHEGINIDFIEAVDGSTVVLTDEEKKLFEGNDFGYRRGFIGCALSHLNIWKSLIDDQKHDKYIIFEDDIEFHDAFKMKLSSVLETKLDHDIIYFGLSVRRSDKNKYLNKIKPNEQQILPYDTNISIGGLFGYIITKKGAQKMIDFINKNGIKHGIDYLFIKYKNELNISQLEVVPHLVFTEFAGQGVEIDSDIQYDHESVVI